MPKPKAKLPPLRRRATADVSVASSLTKGTTGLAKALPAAIARGLSSESSQSKLLESRRRSDGDERGTSTSRKAAAVPSTSPSAMSPSSSSSLKSRDRFGKSLGKRDLVKGGPEERSDSTLPSDEDSFRVSEASRKRYPSDSMPTHNARPTINWAPSLGGSGGREQRERGDSRSVRRPSPPSTYAGRSVHRSTLSRSALLAGKHSTIDASEFSESYDPTAPPVGLDMGGHDTHLMGPKVVMLDAFVVDLLNVDTSAQTFRLKLLVNLDWEDDGTLEEETKAKRNLGRGTVVAGNGAFGKGSSGDVGSFDDTYKTGKYVLREECRDDPLGSTWNPEVVLVNAIADEDPIEAGSKFHSVQMLSGRPVASRSVLYQPECRCEFTFSNFPFDETNLVVKLTSNKWNAEQVQFMWSHRLHEMGRDAQGNRFSLMGEKQMSFLLGREGSFLQRSVDQNAIGGVGLSEFEIIKVRVETDEKDVNSMQRYDNAEGHFSQAHLIIRVRRDPYSYLLRVASVAELLMFLEVLSFLTDSSDLSARFSISGTIFLAMVSLYGPMADALPKVSVVTRVDKWHLYNFVLLFASNIENLVAFVLRGVISHRVMYYTEVLLVVLYMHLVLKNLVWFITPLRERDEYILLVDWFEDTVDLYKDKVQRVVDKIFPWRRKKPKVKIEDPGDENSARGTVWKKALTAIRSTKVMAQNDEQPAEPNKRKEMAKRRTGIMRVGSTHTTRRRSKIRRAFGDHEFSSFSEDFMDNSEH